MAIYKGKGKKNSLMMGLLIAVVTIILLLVLVAVFSGNSKTTSISNHKASTLRDNASSDTPVETLKTLTAEVSTVQQQNQLLVEQNKALIEQDKKTLAEFKTDVMNQVQQQVSTFKTENQALMEDAKKSIGQVSQSNNNGSNNNGTTNNTDNHLVWVDDLQASPSSDALSAKGLQSTDDNNSGLLLNSSSTSTSTEEPDIKQKKKSVAYYTIPVNATLTGAIALQPIIGRVPIDGKVPDPYTFKAVIGAKNLAANGIDIPPDIQGIVVAGVASGDMLGSCARGEITAMTFVFVDGRISTTQAKLGEYLGSIAAANGNPCIKGSFHSNAAIYLGAQATLAGMQGYGNALSQSQLSNTTSATTGASISQLIGNANQYAFGQGFSAAAQSASKWWEQRVQNSFDFIFVPNVDPNTGKKLKLNINITQEVAIDYDFNKRKVFYTHDQNPFNTTNLD